MTELEQQWIAAWKYAGPELAKIRERELRELPEVAGAPTDATKSGIAHSGLEEFQQWMIRWRVLQAMQEQVDA